MVWPGTARRKAKRRLSSLKIWADMFEFSPSNNVYYTALMICYEIAKGFYESKDWTGIASQYFKAKDLVQKLKVDLG